MSIEYSTHQQFTIQYIVDPSFAMKVMDTGQDDKVVDFLSHYKEELIQLVVFRPFAKKNVKFSKFIFNFFCIPCFVKNKTE